MSDVKKIIRDARRDRGWSQRRLAEEAGVGINTVQRTESGETESPAKLDQIMKALQIGIYAPPDSDEHNPRLNDATFEELIAALLRKHGLEIRRALLTTPLNGADTADAELASLQDQLAGRTSRPRRSPPDPPPGSIGYGGAPAHRDDTGEPAS